MSAAVVLLAVAVTTSVTVAGLLAWVLDADSDADAPDDGGWVP